MIGRTALCSALAALSLGLAACGEKPQVLGTGSGPSDEQPWVASTAANPAFMAPGWAGGDAAAWTEQLRKRAQQQNDYAR